MSPEPTEPATESEQAAAVVLSRIHNRRVDVAFELEPADFADEAHEVVAAVRPILAAEFRKAAGDTLADLAPMQATPDARDAFWRAAVITRATTSTAAALRTTTSEESR